MHPDNATDHFSSSTSTGDQPFRLPDSGWQGDAPSRPPAGGFHSVNGVLHYISSGCGGTCSAWRTGSSWSGRPAGRRRRTSICPISGAPGAAAVPHFDGRVRAGAAHWKIEAIDDYAGDARRSPGSTTTGRGLPRLGRAAAPRPTLIIETLRHEGMREEHVEAAPAGQKG